MATDPITNGPDLKQLSAYLATKIGRAAEKTLEASDAYRGLSKQLESASALSTTSDEMTLRDAATSMRAISLHAIVTACALVAVAERISVYAELREIGG